MVFFFCFVLFFFCPFPAVVTTRSPVVSAITCLLGPVCINYLAFSPFSLFATSLDSTLRKTAAWLPLCRGSESTAFIGLCHWSRSAPVPVPVPVGRCHRDRLGRLSLLLLIGPVPTRMPCILIPPLAFPAFFFPFYEPPCSTTTLQKTRQSFCPRRSTANWRFPTSGRLSASLARSTPTPAPAVPPGRSGTRCPAASAYDPLSLPPSRVGMFGLRDQAFQSRLLLLLLLILFVCVK